MRSNDTLGNTKQLISDFIHPRLGPSVEGDCNIATASRCFVFADLRPAFPTGPSVCLGGGRGEEEELGATGFQFK